MSPDPHLQPAAPKISLTISALWKTIQNSSSYFSGRVRRGRIMLPMTKAQRRAKWTGTPSPIHHWMEALLRVVAMLWSIVATTFQMSPSRRARECDTPPAPQALPGGTRDTIKETNSAVTHSRSHEVLMLRAPKGRVSKHEDVLTAPSHTADRQGDCHPGSAQRCPGPIPRHRDSQTHGSRLSSAHALAAGMTPLASARSRDSRAPG